MKTTYAKIRELLTPKVLPVRTVLGLLALVAVVAVSNELTMGGAHALGLGVTAELMSLAISVLGGLALAGCSAYTLLTYWSKLSGDARILLCSAILAGILYLGSIVYLWGRLCTCESSSR